MEKYKFFKKGEKLSDKELCGFVDSLFETDRDYSRTMQDRVTFRNILYLCGEQWIEYVRTLGSFRRRQFPQFIPTPVDNEIRSFVRAIRALYLSQQLIPVVVPNTNEREDIRAAELASQFLTWLDTIHDNEIKFEKEKLIDWLCIGGTGFLRTVPEMEAGPWFVDKNGDVVQTGDVITRNVINFNVIVDDMGENLRDKRWIGIRSLVPKEWVEDTFKVKIEQEGSERAIDYQKKLMKLVSQVSLWKGHGLESVSVEMNNEQLVLFKELEVKPSLKYPKGKYIVVSGNKTLLNLDQMPIPASDGRWSYSITDFHYNRIPGRFWSDAGVNDLISPQNKINEIDQALIMNRKGIGRPRIITPVDLSLKRISDGGQGFLALKYDALLSGGQAPEFDSGTPLPQQVLQERDNAKIQIQDLTGDPKNVLRGNAPSSKSSGIMVDILRETAERGHAPDIDSYNIKMSAVYRKRLLLARQVITEPRKITILGRNKEAHVIDFMGSDIRNNTDVKMELETGLATTRAGRKQIMMDLLQYRFWEIPDPEIRAQYLKKLGLSGFAEKVDVDRERAERENSNIATGRVEGIYLAEIDEQSGDIRELNDDPKFEFDNHQVHFEIHRRFIVADEFNNITPDLQEIAINHADMHRMILMQEKQTQMAQAMQAQGQQGQEPEQEEIY